MLHEEFTKLTGVQVSHRYYTEKVEPIYDYPGNGTKEEWCAEWVKLHKKNIIKAHVFDIEALSQDIAMMDAIKSQGERLRAEKRECEVKISNLQHRVNELQFTSDESEKDIAYLKESLDEQKAALQKQYNVRQTSENALEAAQCEITALKAKLYDMMMNAEPAANPAERQEIKMLKATLNESAIKAREENKETCKLIDWAATIDFAPLKKHLRSKISYLHLELEEIEISQDRTGELRITFQSQNLSPVAGVASAMFSDLRVDAWSNWLQYTKSGEMRYAVCLHWSHKLACGGSNGNELGFAEYTEDGGWQFRN